MTAEILRLAENKRPDLTFSLYLKPRHLSSYRKAITENKMTFTQSIKTCLSKYATFSGTASRSEFWWFALFTLLLNCFALFIYFAASDSPRPHRDLNSTSNDGVIFYMVHFGTLIPFLSAGSRRLHDMGNSGWWQLLYLTLYIPTPLYNHDLTHIWVGLFPLTIMLAINTKNEDNRFKPKSRRSTKTRVSQ